MLEAALAPALDQLVDDGWLERDRDGFAPTPRWRGALMRAAASLVGTDAPEDARIPIALVMLEQYADRDVTPLVVAMSWVVANESRA